jgi:hypothetical protein
MYLIFGGNIEDLKTNEFSKMFHSNLVEKEDGKEL